MVLYGGLQLLPYPARIEGTFEHFGGRKMLPAAHASDGCEPNRLHLDGGGCASYSGLCARRYGIITRNYHGPWCREEPKPPAPLGRRWPTTTHLPQFVFGVGRFSKMGVFEK